MPWVASGHTMAQQSQSQSGLTAANCPQPSAMSEHTIVCCTRLVSVRVAFHLGTQSETLLSFKENVSNISIPAKHPHGRLSQWHYGAIMVIVLSNLEGLDRVCDHKLAETSAVVTAGNLDQSHPFLLEILQPAPSFGQGTSHHPSVITWMVIQSGGLCRLLEEARWEHSGPQHQPSGQTVSITSPALCPSFLVWTQRSLAWSHILSHSFHDLWAAFKLGYIRHPQLSRRAWEPCIYLSTNSDFNWVKHKTLGPKRLLVVSHQQRHLIQSNIDSPTQAVFDQPGLFGQQIGVVSVSQVNKLAFDKISYMSFALMLSVSSRH